MNWKPIWQVDLREIQTLRFDWRSSKCSFSSVWWYCGRTNSSSFSRVNRFHQASILPPSSGLQTSDNECMFHISNTPCQDRSSRLHLEGGCLDLEGIWQHIQEGRCHSHSCWFTLECSVYCYRMESRFLMLFQVLPVWVEQSVSDHHKPQVLHRIMSQDIRWKLPSPLRSEFQITSL